MISRTYLRVINNLILNKLIILSIIKRIVTFYYNSILFHPNIFKNYSKMSTTNTNDKNYLEYLKAASQTNINFIY